MPPASRVSWAERLVFPGLVTAMVIGNQGWTVGPFLTGQMISWFVNVAAVVVLVRFYRGRLWPFVLVAGIVSARAVGSGSQGEGLFDAVYLWQLNALFCLAGSVSAFRYLPVIHRQLRWLCLLSVVIMVLQVTGTGEWPQALATENAEQDKVPSRTLFVSADELQYQTIQARPSGPLHSNNFLSLIVLFAVALQHGDPARRRLNRWDLTVGTMAILSMAKIVLLGTVLLTMWQQLLGNVLQRARGRRFAVLCVLLFSLYRVLFPGLFDVQMNESHIGYSFYIRVNDFVDRLPPDNRLVLVLEPYLVGTPRLDAETGDTGFSGYSQGLRWLPVLLGGGLLMMPMALRAFRQFKRRFAGSHSVPQLVGIVVIVFPGAVPFLGAQIFWFIVGFAIFPIVMSDRFHPRTGKFIAVVPAPPPTVPQSG